MLFRVTKKLTFRQRLLRQAVSWGVPMLCLDLIGVPFLGWGTVLGIAVPATFAGVFAGAVLEHFLISAQVKQNERRASGNGS